MERLMQEQTDWFKDGKIDAWKKDWCKDGKDWKDKKDWYKDRKDWKDRKDDAKNRGIDGWMDGLINEWIRILFWSKNESKIPGYSLASLNMIDL